MERRGGSEAVLELHVNELRQLFNAMDPAPFRERDLDPNAEAYIFEWARDTRSGPPYALVVHLGGGETTPANRDLLHDAVHEHFRQRAASTRMRLRQLFRTGRISLLVGLAFVAVAGFAAEYVGALLAGDGARAFVADSLAIGAWVALWRPLEIFLYDWWPIRSEARLLDRLGEMDVRLLAAQPEARPA
jgi:hypothetical protein